MRQVTLQDDFRVYQLDCKARNLSNRTIELNDCGFKALQLFLGRPDTAIDGLNPETLRQFFTTVSHSKSPSASARYYDVLSSFLRWCVLETYLADNPIANVHKPKKRDTPIVPLEIEQIDRMIKACGQEFTGIRNKLIICMLYDTGMRASELTNVSLCDVNQNQQTIQVRYAKGNKTRVVPYGNATAKLLGKYLVLRGDLQSDRLIVNCYGEPTDRYRIRTIVVQTAGKAGIRATTHMLRHSCAIAMIRNGCDVFSVQKLLGHSTLAMTKRYSQIADTDVQDKHRMFSPGDRVGSLNRHGRKMLR